MKPLNNENGGGTAMPTPDAIAHLATAISTYLANQPEGKRNEQWLALPRPLVELGIEIAIDWLDQIDRQAEAPENAL
jgi:hypothetical protein